MDVVGDRESFGIGSSEGSPSVSRRSMYASSQTSNGNAFQMCFHSCYEMKAHLFPQLPSQT